MQFDSLSEAIRYYSTPQTNPLSGVSPYGLVAAEANQVPSDLNNFKTGITGVMIYGQTIWGQSQIIGVSKQPL